MEEQVNEEQVNEEQVNEEQVTEDQIIEEQIEEVMLSEDDFNALLQNVWERFVKMGYTYMDGMRDDLDQLFKEAKEDMDEDSYVKLLFICAKRFEHEENKRACVYCAMRLEEILKKIEKGKKTSKFLRRTPILPCSIRDNFIKEKISFMKPHLKEMSQKLLVMTLVMFMILVAILIIFLSIDWPLAVLEAIVMSAIAYLVNRLRLPKMFWKKQLDALVDDVDKVVLELDMPIRFG